MAKLATNAISREYFLDIEFCVFLLLSTQFLFEKFDVRILHVFTKKNSIKCRSITAMKLLEFHCTHLLFFSYQAHAAAMLERESLVNLLIFHLELQEENGAPSQTFLVRFCMLAQSA